MGKQARHEKKFHGKAEFPFDIYPCSIPLDFLQVPVHWHEAMEMIAIKKGRGQITVDTKIYKVKAGEGIAVFPGQLHGISCGAGESMEYENIIFLPSMLMAGSNDRCTEKFLRPMAEGKMGTPLLIAPGLKEYDGIMEWIRRLDFLGERQEYGYELEVKGALMSFLGLAVRAAEGTLIKRPPKARERMKGILDYLEEHYGERITVEDGARHCFYSNSHFMKYFRNYMGISFVRYVNEFRLEKAAGFLQEGEEPVAWIAQRCGFDNISYFNRLFRRKYGITPGEYRKSRRPINNSGSL